MFTGRVIQQACIGSLDFFVFLNVEASDRKMDQVSRTIETRLDRLRDAFAIRFVNCVDELLALLCGPGSGLLWKQIAMMQ